MGSDSSHPSSPDGAPAPPPEERFQALFSHALDAILIADDSARYIDANPAACAMLGMSHAQLLGCTIFQLAGVPPEHTDALWRQFLSEGTQKGEFELNTADGRRIWVEYSARAHFLPGQHLSFLREVTRRKRAETLLALLTEASEVLVGSLDQAQVLRALPELAVKQLADVCLVGLLDQGQLRQAAAAYRDPKHEPVVRELQHYQPPASLTGPIRQALRAHQTLRGRTTPEQAAAYVGDAHLAQWVRALQPHAYLVLPLATRKRTLGALVLLSARPGARYEEEDQVAALELARLAALALENAQLYAQSHKEVTMRRELMAMVAHDLRNPLNALSLRARVLERRARLREDEPVQADAQAFQRIVHQMERLLADLVDLTSIDAGGLCITPRPQPVGELMAEMMELIEPLGEQRRVKVQMEPLEQPLAVRCDHDRLLQVLSNLLGNALKYTPAGGRVTMRVVQRGSMAVFSVSDTGVGLEAEELPHVFERYWRAPGAKTTAGLGLGLAIVKGIVEAHGGQVWAESQPGQGSTFSFSLPLASAQPTGADATGHP